MYLEMNCQCGAGIQMEGINENFVLLYGTRFADSHVSCGFITPLTKDKQERTTRHDINFKTNDRNED